MVKPASWFVENDPDLSAADRADWIAVLPLGAHEQHGPHLPFETDTIIASGIARRDWHAPCPRICP
jgi:creatinine amidohydrolase